MKVGKMVILTGDTHGEFERIFEFCEKHNTTKEDVIIILGDVGFNYHHNQIDITNKTEANNQPITWFCIKGNHEKYAALIDTYEEVVAFGGKVYVEPEYPNILFAKDGEVYTFIVNGVEKKALVIGGAYSVDKHYRLQYGMKWFPDEQPSEKTKKLIEDKIDELKGSINYLFSHTCPKRFIPNEWFISDLDQSTVDETTEVWLDTIYDKLEVEKFYCGHFHGSKVIDNLRFLFEDYVELGR